jgi:valyl-tRNA synthetase
VHPEFAAYVSLRGLIDVAAEVKRLEKQLAEKRQHLKGIQAKLDNPNFVGKAPPDVVQQQRDLVADLQNQIAVLEANLHDLRSG